MESIDKKSTTEANVWAALQESERQRKDVLQVFIRIFVVW